MKRGHFDALVKQLHLGEIGRRRFLWRAATLGLGASAAGAGLTAAQSSVPTPTPTVTSGVIIQPTPVGPGNIVANPTATATPVPPSPTPVPPAEPTATPPVEMAGTAIPEPTATPLPAVAEEPTGGTGQTVPCPPCEDETYAGFWPWEQYPIIAPSPTVPDPAGIRWYGLRVDEGGGAATVEAFGADRRGVSRAEGNFRGGDGHATWVGSDAQTRLEAAVTAEVVGSDVRLSGELDGQRFSLLAHRDGTVDVESGAPSLDPAQLALVNQWTPFAAKLGGMIDVLAANEGGGGSPTAGSGACAAAGLVAGASTIGCLVSFGLGCIYTYAAGSYIADNCVDEW